MTLILTVANRSGVYQSSDYKLTDPVSGAPVSDRAGSKQLQATFQKMDLQVAFTGVAEVGVGARRQRTIDWLSSALKELPHDSPLQSVCEALKQKISPLISPLGDRGFLHIVITAATVGKPFRIAEISNADWRSHPPKGRSRFTIRIRPVTKPFHLISGCRESVPIAEEFRLEGLVRGAMKSPAHILDALAEINAAAAKRSIWVSEACWVTSQIADGRARRTASRNSGQHPGDIPMIRGGRDLSEFVKHNFRNVPGKEITLVQSAGAVLEAGDMIPMAQAVGDTRQISLAGSPVEAALHTPEGQPGALVKLVHADCVFETRRNEEFVVPFATIVLNGICAVDRDFPKPLFPWHQLRTALTIDGNDVPRGWQYSIGYWVEKSAHHVVVPQSSRSVRNIACLGPDDEIMIVLPSSTMEFTWRDGEEGPSATINARISWRSRMDGTLG